LLKFYLLFKTNKFEVSVNMQPNLILWLNMFLVFQLLVKIRISPSWKP